MSDELTRREFLQLGGAALAEAVLPKIPLPAPALAEKPAPIVHCGGWQIPWQIPWGVGDSQCHKAIVPIVIVSNEG